MIAIEYDKRGKERIGKMPINKRKGRNSIFLPQQGIKITFGKEKVFLFIE